MTADLSLPPQASLLGLPSELRVRIYHYLFSSVCAKDDTLRYYIYGSSAHVSHPRDPRLFALRRVCKILRHEVQDIRPPIRDVTFVFYRTTYDDLRRWINNTELSFIQKLRKWEVESSRSKVVLDLARFEQDVAAGMHGFPLSGWSGVYTEVDDIMLDYGYVRRFVRSDDGIWSPDNEVEVILDFTNNYHGLVEPWDTTANVQPDHLLVSFEALYYEEEGISPDHIGNASRVGEVEDVGTTDVTYPRASLLGLPLNIRMRVYEHLFGRRQDNGPHVHLYGSLDPDSRGPPDAHPLGLLGASAKFRRELKSEMGMPSTRHTIFCFHNFTENDFQGWMDAANASVLRHMRRWQMEAWGPCQGGYFHNLHLVNCSFHTTIPGSCDSACESFDADVAGYLRRRGLCIRRITVDLHALMRDITLNGAASASVHRTHTATDSASNYVQLFGCRGGNMHSDKCARSLERIDVGGVSEFTNSRGNVMISEESLLGCHHFAKVSNGIEEYLQECKAAVPTRIGTTEAEHP